MKTTTAHSFAFPSILKGKDTSAVILPGYNASSHGKTRPFQISTVEILGTFILQSGTDETNGECGPTDAITKGRTVKFD
jgi:hypothetical protein